MCMILLLLLLLLLIIIIIKQQQFSCCEISILLPKVLLAIRKKIVVGVDVYYWKKLIQWHIEDSALLKEHIIFQVTILV